jgi:hypothetical protein
VGPATVAADGTYTATLPAPTADGPLTVTVNSTDAAGNTATDTRTLTIDRGTAVTITGVEGGGLTPPTPRSTPRRRGMVS